MFCCKFYRINELIWLILTHLFTFSQDFFYLLRHFIFYRQLPFASFLWQLVPPPFSSVPDFTASRQGLSSSPRPSLDPACSTFLLVRVSFSRYSRRWHQRRKKPWPRAASALARGPRQSSRSLLRSRPKLLGAWAALRVRGPERQTSGTECRIGVRPSGSRLWWGACRGWGIFCILRLCAWTARTVQVALCCLLFPLSSRSDSSRQSRLSLLCHVTWASAWK